VKTPANTAFIRHPSRREREVLALECGDKEAAVAQGLIFENNRFVIMETGNKKRGGQSYEAACCFYRFINHVSNRCFRPCSHA
jgi:hypothetical protein